MERPSLKKEIVSMLLEVSASKELKDHQLFVLTSLGVISGEAYTISEIDDLDNFKDLSTRAYDVIAKSLLDEHKNYKEAYNIETRLPGNDGFLLLKNAKVQSATGQPMHFGQLIVFFDQIIAVSFGTTINN